MLWSYTRDPSVSMVMNDESILSHQHSSQSSDSPTTTTSDVVDERDICCSSDEYDYNQDEPKCMGCAKITDEEHFLLCDNDEVQDKHGAHIYCLDPPLKSIPKQDWFCPKCSNTKYISKRCVYCSSKMYRLDKKDLLKCSSLKCNYKAICHLQCAEKVNNIKIELNSKWQCPLCENKKVIK